MSENTKQTNKIKVNNNVLLIKSKLQIKCRECMHFEIRRKPGFKIICTNAGSKKSYSNFNFYMSFRNVHTLHKYLYELPDDGIVPHCFEKVSRWGSKDLLIKI